MLAMTSLIAQNQFGNLIDTSQRQPVAVTRHGRPVAVVMSYDDYMQRQKTIPFEVAATISESFPLRGSVGAKALRKTFDGLADHAAIGGLTQADVTRMLNEP